MEKINFYFNMETYNCEIPYADNERNKMVFFDEKLKPLSIIYEDEEILHIFTPKNEPMYCLGLPKYSSEKYVDFYKIEKIDYVDEKIYWTLEDCKDELWFKRIYNKYHEIQVKKMRGYSLKEDEIGEEVFIEDLVREYAKMHFINC